MRAGGTAVDMTAATRERLLDELREVWLDEWRSRWQDEHTEEEMDEAMDGDSSAGGHPFWTEPTEESLAMYAEYACRVLADHFMQRDGASYVVEELLRIGGRT